MTEKQLENLELLNEKLDAIYPHLKGIFSECVVSLYDKEDLEEVNEEEVYESIEDWQSNRYIIAFNELSGDYYFCDLDEDNSPVYFYQDGEDILECGRLENFTEFIIETNEILNDEQDEKIERALKSLEKHLADKGFYYELDAWLEANIEE